MNKYMYCGVCQKVKETEEFQSTRCDMCKCFALNPNCTCNCYLCDDCENLKYSKMYNKNTYAKDEKAQLFKNGYYLNVCDKCDKVTESLPKHERQDKIMNCLIEHYPNAKFEKRKDSCCTI